ncbi:SET domain-containing protein [Corynespora cassiicola Philippines]|uniref:SET domain-containing protein n=1 Tax=Corynespora cassiicola Philippines TaxID=1448308 RepID=A0A2T2P6A2_CORCC|nr:SET domain-containing protein [Corynespora cassiicola Philippines]
MPPMVVIPTNGRASRRVLLDRIHSIICHRSKGEEEEYLVRWKADGNNPGKPPISWHNVYELSRALEYVQDYLDTLQDIHKAIPLSHSTKKRKSPDTEGESGRRSSPAHRGISPAGAHPNPSHAVSRPWSSPSNAPSTPNVYNGCIDTDSNGFIFARSALGVSAELDIKCIPTPEMVRVARRSKADRANQLIRSEYTRRLAMLPGKAIHLNNIYDGATPSLRFRYISENVLRQGVYKADPATQTGCRQCSPHMGRDIGCEYTKKCDCLEYAAVDESRLDPETKKEYDYARATGGSLMGFPKKFPYFSDGTKIQRAGALVPFYLHSRRAIYECNDNCNCGPYCRNKNVQFGRRVELEIFRTGTGRGWGLRCREKLHQGQFIDTYRGEIITDEEATKREESSDSKAKASYLYSLDKFAESEDIPPEEIYVIDGEFMGGPTKFMNHSCEPNCRQYTVSYNKHDYRIYDIAFFACQDIEAGEELTFDYLDKEAEEEMEDPDEGAIPCLCRSENCRKWLWT